ncbi:MAG: hypothetical protein HY537_14825 [Deltaproteobacteria bacterium]|nr:hypothetical protein [Deltaproteobacteria bacterium]
MLSWIRLLKIAFSNLFVHKLRSVFTVIGIIFGTGAAVATLAKNISKRGRQTFESRRADQISAFREGIAFIERVMSLSVFPNLSEKIQKDFAAALSRERRGLESWQNAKE